MMTAERQAAALHIATEAVLRRVATELTESQRHTTADHLERVGVTLPMERKVEDQELLEAVGREMCLLGVQLRHGTGLFDDSRS